jgi:hypothetical protein
MHTSSQRLFIGFVLGVTTYGAVADTVNFALIPGAGGAHDISPDGRDNVGETPVCQGGQPNRVDTLTKQILILPAPGISA